MDYSEEIARSKAYIENHLREKLTAEQLARQAGYSLCHFCRVFSREQGMPPMDYVRAVRLRRAREEMRSGRKLIDLALDFGFETPSGFSKAFRHEFGYSPTVYLARVGGYQNQMKNGGIRMNPKIVEKPAFKVAGYGIKTDVTGTYTKDVAAWWNTYVGENLEEKMYARLQPPKHGEVGVIVPHAPGTEDGHVTYLLGVVVEDFSKATLDMLTVEIPAATYAVFTTPPVDNVETADTYVEDPLSETVKATWNEIFDRWFETSGYEFDEGKVDFEFYDERCHGPKDTVMDIYVPIRKKEA